MDGGNIDHSWVTNIKVLSIGKGTFKTAEHAGTHKFPVCVRKCA